MDIQAKAEMLIRVNRNAVFNAFAQKDQLCKFWLDHASADLAVGANVEWHFMVPGAKEKVNVTKFVQDEQITFKWSDGLVVDMQFSDYEHGQTLASVVATGFKGKDACSQAIGGNGRVRNRIV